MIELPGLSDGLDGQLYDRVADHEPGSDLYHRVGLHLQYHLA